METVNNTNKSGFVAVMGRPNVGKSTLINALLGEKIAAVSPWPQTTRKKQLGILTNDMGQIIFVDTPGIHNPIHKLGQHMNEEARSALEDSDVILLLVDVSQPPSEDDRNLANTLMMLHRSIPVLMALNKSDIASSEEKEKNKEAFEQLLPRTNANIQISATNGDNLDHLISLLFTYLPEGPNFFPDDQITDLYERDIAADLTREAALYYLRDEVPHSIAVRIDEFTERGDTGAFIAATIFVERESQKGIVIGKNGKMLKQIGSAARKEIEKMSGRKVFLKLRVKIRKNWRNDESSLKLFGFREAK
jgi:GTP-binding protein Era